MVKRLIACWALLAFLCAAYPAKAEPYSLTETIAVMRVDGVSVTVHWEPCGQWNAYYDPDTRTVTMCTELLTSPPAVVRMVAAHELAHAILRQRDVPFTGLEEAAADELAAVKMIEAGHASDVMEIAEFWHAQTRGEIPWDPHPSPARRAFSLACLFYGHLDPATACSDTWLRTERAWKRLLSL